MRSPPRQTGGFRSARGRRNDGRALRAQFHGEAGNEALPGRSRSLDAVDAVAPMLTIGGSSGVQHDIAVSGAGAASTARSAGQIPDTRGPPTSGWRPRSG